jgi:hypothetical protein
MPAQADPEWVARLRYRIWHSPLGGLERDPPEPPETLASRAREWWQGARLGRFRYVKLKSL